MTMRNAAALQWPALQGSAAATDQIVFERGVLGKVHGAPSDFCWIAVTPGLTAPEKHLEEELALGPQDAGGSATLWRVLGDTCYAVAYYPSDAVDAAGRRGFLEKQIVEWKRPAEIPAAVGALLLLPLVASLHSGVRWSEDDHPLDLAAPPVRISAAAIESAAAEGLRALRELIEEEALTEMYASLLAGNRAVTLKGLATPLPPSALAAVLLPLPREIADELSIAGWLPSTRLSETDVDDVRRCWGIVGGGASVRAENGPHPTAEHVTQARAMSRSILAEAPPERTAVDNADTAKAVDIALWGPSAAGKTALIAKLFLDATGDENWEVYPSSQSLGFIEAMQERIKTGNLFPVASATGRTDGIEYIFTHQKSGMMASLRLEDRAGAESEDLTFTPSDRVSLKQRLTSAAGLVLLFDPFADKGALEALVSKTLRRLNVESGRIGRKDERPIAVCVSKADVLIETPADFQRALSNPHNFVRERVSQELVVPLDRYCANYRLFPVSAAGVRVRHGSIEPAVFYDETLEPRICPGGRPFNLMAPFTWILNQVTG
jgi:hypothetical protein